MDTCIDCGFQYYITKFCPNCASTSTVNKILKSTKELTPEKELALAHWSYIRGVLETQGVQEDEIVKIGFHYVTAFEHGFKHGEENKNEKR